MSFSFTNIAMLAGLAVVVLPVLAHLLSKRRFDVVQWGAMQFLQLGQKTRRRIRLQDLLLLFLRMLLLACLALAMARPYGQGGLFNSLGQVVSRDVVFILDGSGSTGWKGERQTPHAAGVQWIHKAIEELHPGDTVALIEARSRNRRLIHPPTSSLPLVRKTLDQISAPTGTSHLGEAVLDALRILAATSNVTREIIVLTDGQAFPWRIDDEFGLQRIDDALNLPDVLPEISLVNLSRDQQERTNCSVGPIELSRPMTVPGFPIRFRSTLRQSGGVSTQKEVSLAINGQPAPDSNRVVNLLPNGEALVEFEHVFSSTGLFRLSLSIEEDDLPSDDQSDVIVLVENGINVLLVDGAANVDATQSETFFLKSAFGASGEESPWVRTQVVQPSGINSEALANARIVFLCNVKSISAQQQLELVDFVLVGGGLVFAPGNQIDPAHWNGFFYDKDQHVLPASIRDLKQVDPAQAEAVTIDPLTLEVPWLKPFRKENGVDFWLARFSSWWSLDLIVLEEVVPSVPVEDEDSAESSRSTILSKFTTGDPFLLGRRLGEGSILQFAVPLDADWSTLPARSDYVPFLHEMVFRLARMETQHNVSVGMPIRILLAEEERPRDYQVIGPGIAAGTPELTREGRKSFATFAETSIPGLYWFEKRNSPQAPRIPFVVTDDRGESDLTPIDQLGWETLAANDRMRSIETMSDLTNRVQSQHSRTELWWLLLLLLLVILIGEVALTRKMLQDGHAEFAE